MALISCPGCGKQISNTVRTCPKCNQPIGSVVHQNTGISAAPVSAQSSKAGMVALIVIILIVGRFMFAGALGSNQDIQKVKTGKMLNYQNKTIGEAVDGFFGSPSWESLTASDGNVHVNVKGKITYMQKEVEALMQFRLDKNTDRFEINALEFNGIPQNNFMIIGLIKKMYD